MEKYSVDSFEEKLQKVLLANPKAKEESVRKYLKFKEHSCKCKFCEIGNNRHGFSLKQMDDIINGND